MSKFNYYLSEGASNTASKLFSIIKDADFNLIDSERFNELNYKIDKFRKANQVIDVSLKVGIYYSSDKLITSYTTTYGLKDENELAYFIINLLDSNLNLYNLLKEVKTIEELKQVCFQKYKIYPPVLIKLESRYVKYLNNIEENLRMNEDYGRK